MRAFVLILFSVLTLRAEVPDQVSAVSVKDGTKEPEHGTIYSPIGKRDPFNRLLTDEDSKVADRSGSALEKYSVEQFQLRAVLRGLGQAKAMFEDPEGSSHILGEGDTIGREHATISRIINSEVIITQRTFNYLGAESLLEKVLSLPKNGPYDETISGARLPPARRTATDVAPLVQPPPQNAIGVPPAPAGGATIPAGGPNKVN